MTAAERPIGDLVDKCKTWNPRTKGNGGFDYIDLSSVNKDTKSIDATEHCQCSEAPSRARQLVEIGDVLVATVRPNLNGVARVSRAEHGMTASTGYCVLRPKKDRLDSSYLFHWVKTDTFIRRMVNIATGANYPAVSDAKVKTSTIPILPLAEQKRIATILDAADAMRAKRRESIAQFGRLLQSVFFNMFGGSTTSGNGGRSIWMRAPLGEFVTEFRGGASIRSDDFADSGFPVLHKGSIQPGGYLSLDRNGKVHVSEGFAAARKGAVVDSAFVVATLRNLVRSGETLGFMAPILDDGKYLLAQGACGLRIDESYLNRHFLSHLSNSWEFHKEVMRRMVGSTQVHIRNGDFLSIPIPLPPLDLQKKFAAVVASVEQQKVVQRLHLEQLGILFSSLQSRAFLGDL